MGEKIIRLRNMPCIIRAYTLLDGNGDYNIYLNARLTMEKQLEALEHEMKHIEADDFYSLLDAEECERRVKYG